MIDFLEEAVIWKDNPIRENVALAISDVILSETFLSATHDARRQLVGDKIELFTILTEQTSEKAVQLLSKVQGTKLEPILNYATRRLPVPVLLTVDELAAFHKVSPHTIYYWVSRSEIPALRLGKHLRFDRDRVLAHFEGKAVNSALQSGSFTTSRDLADSSKKGSGNGNH